MIRKYTKFDKSKLIELLRQNTPKYFDFSEESDFKNYLENEIEDYFVYEKDSEIIGAGGINYFPKEKLARLSWDMIHPKFHNQGIGRELTQFRIDYLNENSKINSIIVRTSQYAYKFYAKMGFELEKIEKDFWAKGFDLYDMKRSNKK